MFKQLTLTNFRKHTDVTFSFAEGLNVIRGANESAKTTICEALAYALFGSRSLRESLDLCVTWGQPVSSLRVELDFTINNTDYKIKRAKSGAELFVGIKLVVTGQTEVTKYVENLLGASADAATKLMMANQASLRGALSDGPAAAVALIESLANFDLINQITELVQEKLPNGNTVSLQSRIDTLTGQLEVPIENGAEAALQVVNGLQLGVAASAAVLAEAESAANAALPAAEEAERLQAAVVEAAAHRARTEKKLLDAQTRLAGIKLPDEIPPEAIAKLEVEIAEAAALAPAKSAWAKLGNMPSSNTWDGPYEDFVEALDKAEANFAAEQAGVNQAKVTLAQLQGKLIKETHCAFCDKDLTDVPEVIQRNSSLAPLIDAEQAKITDSKLTTRKQELADLKAFERDALAIVTVLSACYDFITLDTSTYPAKHTWTGPDVTKQVNLQAASQLAALRQQATQRAKTEGSRQEAAQSVETLEGEVQVAKEALNAANAASSGSNTALYAYNNLYAAALARAEAHGKLETQLASAQKDLVHAQAMLAERVKARQALATQLLNDKQLLTETNFNNALIKKLRSARPQVADKLWGIVLLTVSKYFSSIRGVSSRVTRSDNGFLVDGQTIGGLSGSTLDALGLAIRIALTKTFLPNSRFLILDEASAACDDEREEAMVGCVAGADFDQVIWVTHSAAVEAFATMVIQL
jgi:DNA repair exonuclease SbcCD ATPase subunit